jgi:hypothetical protein
MVSFYQVTVAAALMAVASAAPTEHQRKGFTVSQVVKNPGFKTQPAHAMAKTYLKYGKEVPRDIARAAATSQGTVAASPTQFDSEYLCPVKIGSPAVTLNLDFDTGSSDLYVTTYCHHVSEID